MSKQEQQKKSTCHFKTHKSSGKRIPRVKPVLRAFPFNGTDSNLTLSVKANKVHFFLCNKWSTEKGSAGIVATWSSQKRSSVGWKWQGFWLMVLCDNIVEYEDSNTWFHSAVRYHIYFIFLCPFPKFLLHPTLNGSLDLLKVSALWKAFLPLPMSPQCLFLERTIGFIRARSRPAPR